MTASSLTPHVSTVKTLLETTMIKTTSLTSSLALAFGLLSAPISALAADQVVIVSNALPEAAAKTSLVQSIKVMGAMRPGDSVVFIDGDRKSVV